MAVSGDNITIEKTISFVTEINLLMLNSYLQFCALKFSKIIYRIAGNIGGELNLAVWRSSLKPPN
jgi:hypothetical protein